MFLHSKHALLINSAVLPTLGTPNASVTQVVSPPAVGQSPLVGITLNPGTTQPYHNTAGKLSCNGKPLALWAPFIERRSVSSDQGISEQGNKIFSLVQIRISSRGPQKKSLSLFFAVNTVHSPKIYIGCITWGFVVAFFKQRCFNRYFVIGSRTQDYRRV